LLPTSYPEVKGRTKGRSGAGLDTLYGQLLRRVIANDGLNVGAGWRARREGAGKLCKTRGGARMIMA
jgi:hypothetical protein